MSLRKSVVASIVCTTLVLAVIDHFVSSRLILDSFAALEETAAKENVKRALFALRDEMAKLDSYVFDWSWWDDTYRFVADRNQAYIESNLLDETFRGQRLTLIAFFDTRGRMVWGKCFDLAADAEVPFYTALGPHLAPDAPLLRHPDVESSKAGFLLLDQGPLYLASRPIITSERKGPIRGTLVMGRMLDSGEVAALAKRTRLDLDLRPVGSPDLSSRESSVLAALKDEPEPLALPLDDERLEGYALIPDLQDRPVLLLTVRMARDIYAAGLQAVRFNPVTVLAVSSVFGLTIILLLESLVLAPISRLGGQVNRIGRQRVFSERVAAPGRAELAKLAGDINAMLAELEDSQRSLEARVQERTRELTQANLRLQGEIVDRMHVEQSLQRAKEEAEEANRAKSEFLANMSHEIRTPLSVILSTVDMILDEGAPRDSWGRLDNVKHAARSLQALVDDTLDLAKIEAGKLEIRPAVFDLYDCLKKTVRLFEAQAEAKGLDLDLDIAPDAPRLAVGAADRLAQVLRNLVGNAVKFTERGAVAVQAAAAEARPSGVDLEFTVRDTGIGISPGDMGRLFEMFGQIDSSYAKRRPGSGLGLAISRRLVELMGGTIWAESAPGQGSVFRFRTPLGIPGADEPGPVEPPLPPGVGLSRLEILLAEGGRPEREFLGRALERAGHRVTPAEDGRQALEVLAKRPFDLVLMDVLTPGIGGLEAIRRIRAGTDDRLDAAAPILALAAYGLPDRCGALVDAGADGCLTKPVELDDLFRTMARVLGKVAPAGACAGSSGDGAVLDPAALRQRFAGQEDILSRLAALVVLEGPDRVAGLRRALEAGDLAGAGNLAGRLAGPLGLLQAGRAEGLVRVLADAANAGDATGAATALDGLERELAAVVDILSSEFPPPAGADTA